MGLAIGGGAILVIGGIVFGVMFLMNGKGDDDTADNVARANNSAPSSVPNTVANNGQTNPVQPNNSQPNPVQPNVVQPNPGQTNPAQPNPANNANANGKLWAVLSNFKSARSNGPFNKSYTIDYRLVSGAPAGTSVVLYISEGRSSVIEHYMEVNLDLRSSGSVTFQVGSTFAIGGRLEANLAIKEGRQKWKPISGKISVGGGQTTSQVPQSVAQKAGASGKGKAVVLANARTESSIGRTVYLVDYVVNQRPVGGFYFLVIKDSRGQGIEFDVSTDLRRAQIGKESEFSGRPIGLSGLSGQITAHIEKRSSPSRSRSRIRRGNPTRPDDHLEHGYVQVTYHSIALTPWLFFIVFNCRRRPASSSS
jgi:hypothetical protein